MLTGISGRHACDKSTVGTGWSLTKESTYPQQKTIYKKGLLGVTKLEGSRK